MYGSTKTRKNTKELQVVVVCQFFVLFIGFPCMHTAKDKKWGAIVNSMDGLNTKISKKDK